MVNGEGELVDTATSIHQDVLESIISSLEDIPGEAQEGLNQAKEASEQAKRALENILGDGNHMRKLLMAGVLIILIATGTWYAFLGGQEYIEAVAVEITTRHSPIASSPVSDIEINIDKSIKGIYLTLDAYHKGFLEIN